MNPYPSQAVIEVIPPRINRGDVMTAEMLFGSLMAEGHFSLEVSGDDNGQHLIIRGARATLANIKNQIRAVYSHVEFKDIPPHEDPARQDGRCRVTAELMLERPTYFPLRIFEDGAFETADPLRALLGALKGLEKNERAASQLILTPAPFDWARKYMPMAQPPQRRAAGETVSFRMEAQHGLGCAWIFGTAVLSMMALLRFGAQDWLGFVLWAISAGLCFSGLGWGWTKLAYPTPVAPKMVEQKISRPAFQAVLRLYAYANTDARALDLVQRLNGAYKQFGMANGNTFKGHRREFDPQVLMTEPINPFQELRDQVMRLNLTELAALWHLPTGETVKAVEHTMARRLLPVRRNYFAQGVLVGHAEAQGERVPIHLAPQMLEHNTFMIAKTQKGKSTLMAHLALAAMQEDMALVVIDPHGDLAKAVSGLVPRQRVSQVRYLDWSDKQRAVGLNFLDVQQGCDPGVIISNIVHAGTEIWTDNWGPRMEDALRHALRTLLEANDTLARHGQEQFTLLDVNALFQLPTFRRRLIKHHVRNPETINWWQRQYDHLSDSLRMDVISPVITKLDRLAENATLKNIVGQSRSTLNFREVLSERGIVLINTASGQIGNDTAGLLAALFIDSLNFAIRDQTAIADSRQRPRVMVIIDELQTLVGVDYKSFLAELRKMGASFVMGTQSLAQLDPAAARAAQSAVLSNIDTLFVFDTNEADADILSRELDQVVDSTDIINLPDHTAYLKTQVGSERSETLFVKILPPAVPDPMVHQQIGSQVVRYTLPTAETERRRQNFVNQWYGRDLQMGDRDSVDDDDSRTDDYGGANPVGYDPKSPIRPKGPVQPPVPPQATGGAIHPSEDTPGKGQGSSKKSQEWGKP